MTGLGVIYAKLVKNRSLPVVWPGGKGQSDQTARFDGLLKGGRLPWSNPLFWLGEVTKNGILASFFWENGQRHGKRPLRHCGVTYLLQAMCCLYVLGRMPVATYDVSKTPFWPFLLISRIYALCTSIVAVILFHHFCTILCPFRCLWSTSTGHHAWIVPSGIRLVHLLDRSAVASFFPVHVNWLSGHPSSVFSPGPLIGRSQLLDTEKSPKWQLFGSRWQNDLFWYQWSKYVRWSGKWHFWRYVSGLAVSENVGKIDVSDVLRDFSSKRRFWGKAVQNGLHSLWGVCGVYQPRRSKMVVKMAFLTISGPS